MSIDRPIVIEHYPAGLLPDELRRDIPENRNVRVTIEAEPEGVPSSGDKPLSTYVGAAKGVYLDPASAIEGLRRIRDEWE